MTLIVPALVAAAAVIRYARDQAEVILIRQEKVRIAHRADARQKELLEREREFFMQKADVFSRYQKLIALSGFLEQNIQSRDDQVGLRAMKRLWNLINELEEQLKLDEMLSQAEKQGLLGDNIEGG